MFGKKKAPQPVGNSMLKLLTQKEQRVVAGGPNGPAPKSQGDPTRP